MYAAWLAARGYTVHLIDPVPLHVEQALARAAEQPMYPFTAALGDALRLPHPSDTYDAALLFGPLYHLTERSDRLAALAEARRVVRPDGRILAVGVSRFASLLDGLRTGFIAGAEFRSIVEQDLRSGQHRNPDPVGRPQWFTSAYFHRPDELREEMVEAGLLCQGVFAIDGPGWLYPERFEDLDLRQSILEFVRAVEAEPTLLGVSAHLLVVGSVPERPLR